MSQDNKLTPREMNIYRALNQRRHQDNTSLFGGQETAPYWTLSDLTIMYSNSFDISQPVSSLVITKINGMVFKAIPNFRDITDQPVHMLNFKETYNAFVKTAHEVQRVKNGTNQKYSPVVCEYLFSQIDGTEFEQAYFLCQNQPVEEIKSMADQIRFVKLRNQTKESSTKLASITKGATGSTINSYSEIWSYLWCRLFGLNSMTDLRTKYKLEGDETILDHMTIAPLSYVNMLLQEILKKLYDRPRKSIYEIKIVIDAAIPQWRIDQFAKYYSDPKNYTEKNTENSIISSVNKARKDFWKKYYPISLKQR